MNNEVDEEEEEANSETWCDTEYHHLSIVRSPIQLQRKDDFLVRLMNPNHFLKYTIHDSAIFRFAAFTCSGIWQRQAYRYRCSICDFGNDRRNVVNAHSRRAHCRNDDCTMIVSTKWPTLFATPHSNVSSIVRCWIDVRHEPTPSYPPPSAQQLNKRSSTNNSSTRFSQANARLAYSTSAEFAHRWLSVFSQNSQRISRVFAMSTVGGAHQ